MLALAAALLSLLPAGFALAQSPSNENGLRIWDGRLHPFADVESHYIYNPGREPGASGLVYSDVALAGRAGFDYDLGKDSVLLESHSYIEYRDFLGIEKSDTKRLSAWSGKLGIDGDFFRDRPLSLRVNELLTRSSDPANQTLTVRLLHWSNDAAAGLDLTPRGGALVLNLEYRFFVDRYDSGQAVSTGFQPKLLDNVRHMPLARINWKFFPKTAIFLEAQGELTRYTDQAGANTSGQPLLNVPSNILLASVGLTGAVTRKISVLAKVGYGNTFIANSDNYTSVIAQFELSYDATSVSRLKAGFLRTVEPTSIFKYVGITRGYASVDQALGQRVLLSLSLQYDDLVYGQPIQNAGVPAGRHDSDTLGKIALAFKIKPWIIVSANDSFDVRQSGYRLPVGYKFNDAFLQLTIRY
jgi:hypothetical protein